MAPLHLKTVGHLTNMKYNMKKKYTAPRFAIDLLGCEEYARLGKPDIPLRRNRFEIDPDLEPAATADMREYKGKGERADEGAPDLGDAHLCLRSPKLVRKASKIVRLLQEDCGLVPLHAVPKYIPCGHLRRAVRTVYASELTLTQELSIKTSQKCESSWCDPCKVLLEHMVEGWKEKRLRPTSVNDAHLNRFARCFRGNVPRGWNLRKTAYVPNGHATKEWSRPQGGNWNATGFSRECKPVAVVSSGKPRIVTLYSERNVAVLTPLHNSLYAFLRKRGWLLVGDPTEERLRQAFSEMPGTEWLSFDYESATDNIKTAYVRRAVEILIEEAIGLSEEEVLCMRTMADLRIDGQVATTGQPMGSPMSFPMLCLINKTVVDLALTQLLEQREIEFKEWTRHRCLINGDDLLMKSTSGGCVASAIREQGASVGLVTNCEKTLRSTDTAEINSTVFVDGRLRRKTNVSALWMGSEVEDVVKFASESCVHTTSIVEVVKNNVSRLAKPRTKVSQKHPWELKKALLRVKSIRTALVSEAPPGPQLTNLFPVEDVPDGFWLSREEQVATIDREVERVRERCLWKSVLARNSYTKAWSKRVATLKKAPRYSHAARALRWKKSPEREKTLAIFVRRWIEKKYEELLSVDPTPVCTSQVVTDFSRVEFILDEIRTFKDKRNVDRPKPLPFEGSGPAGFVSLSDG